MKVTDNAVLYHLQRTLDKVSRGTAVAASNLANVDTPGYRAQQVTFQRALGDARLGLARSAEGHMVAQRDRAMGLMHDAPATRIRLDGNTVDVDLEMTELSRLTGRFSSAAEMVGKRLALLRYAATDGKQ